MMLCGALRESLSTCPVSGLYTFVDRRELSRLRTIFPYVHRWQLTNSSCEPWPAGKAFPDEMKHVVDLLTERDVAFVLDVDIMRANDANEHVHEKEHHH